MMPVSRIRLGVASLSLSCGSSAAAQAGLQRFPGASDRDSRPGPGSESVGVTDSGPGAGGPGAPGRRGPPVPERQPTVTVPASGNWQCHVGLVTIGPSLGLSPGRGRRAAAGRGRHESPHRRGSGRGPAAVSRVTVTESRRPRLMIAPAQPPRPRRAEPGRASASG